MKRPELKEGKEGKLGYGNGGVWELEGSSESGGPDTSVGAVGSARRGCSTSTGKLMAARKSGVVPGSACTKLKEVGKQSSEIIPLGALRQER